MRTSPNKPIATGVLFMAQMARSILLYLSNTNQESDLSVINAFRITRTGKSSIGNPWKPLTVPPLSLNITKMSFQLF